MKYFLLALLAVAGTAHASDWTAADTNREAAFAVLETIDLAQTRWMSKHEPRFSENVPYYGKYPSTGRVDMTFAAEYVVHFAVSRALPERYRKPFQIISISAEAFCVSKNAHIGVKLDF
jgi:hypothetical protein